MHGSSGVVVLGPYRSGTSVSSQVLHALGVDFGPKRLLLPAQQWNPGGFFERFDINDANDALIHSAGKTLAEPGDPRDLARHADPSGFKIADMSWLETSRLWGIKDPRMCATLLAWIESGILSCDDLRIVHVRRELGASVRSAMACEPVRNFCDGDEHRVRSMLHQYDMLAGWHVQQLGLPALELQYEFLIEQPEPAVHGLAEFIGVSDAKRIRQAVRLIGRGKGLISLQLERYFVRAPRRLYRFLTGHWPLTGR